MRETSAYFLDKVAYARVRETAVYFLDNIAYTRVRETAASFLDNIDWWYSDDYRWVLMLCKDLNIRLELTLQY